MLRFQAADAASARHRWGLESIALTLTFLGHSAVHFDLDGLSIYVDPYLRDPVDLRKLPKGHLVLYSHGHFDHGVQLAPQLYKDWGCQFVAPEPLARWMKRKFRRTIPKESIMSLAHGESLFYGETKIRAIAAHHPLNRLGKTIMTLFARSSAPGKPVNGYYFEGYYHSGATMYTPKIKEQLEGLEVHTACLPIGGKYAIATPSEALKIAEEIDAKRLVPMHWQPLMDQVFFRYQPSDLVRLARESTSKVGIFPLAIGETLNGYPTDLAVGKAD